MKSQTATFIGQSACFWVSQCEIEEKVKELVLTGITTFLCGGMGDFDKICAFAVFRLKKIFPHIKLFLVIPYISFAKNVSDIYDEIIYPEGFEKFHFKKAIIMRNRYLVDNSCIAICYVKNKTSRAYKTFAYATKQNIKIIDLAFRSN